MGVLSLLVALVSLAWLLQAFSEWRKTRLDDPERFVASVVQLVDCASYLKAQMLCKHYPNAPLAKALFTMLREAERPEVVMGAYEAAYHELYGEPRWRELTRLQLQVMAGCIAAIVLLTLAEPLVFDGVFRPWHGVCAATTAVAHGGAWGFMLLQGAQLQEAGSALIRVRDAIYRSWGYTPPEWIPIGAREGDTTAR